MSKSKIEAFFPSGKSHDYIGFNDAGVEQFKNARIESLVRECTQNSTDAWDKGDKPVKVTFRLIQVDQLHMPWVSGLAAHIHSCIKELEKVPLEKQDSKALNYFKESLKILKRKTIPVLVVSDENTSGVEGEDSDRQSTWTTLVRARGTSNKNSKSAGGSFGIGKSAPYACSGLRTILYGTKTKDGVAAFGKSLLISHQDPETKKRSELYGIGYIGVKKGDDVCSVRKSEDIPAFLRRDKIGTDIAIIGFEAAEWAEAIKAACVKHFWPALKNHNVIFEISGAGVRINLSSETLKQDIAWLETSEWMNEEDSAYFSLQEGKPSQFLACFTGNHKYQLNLPHDACGELYINIGVPGEGLPGSVCCFRTNAMVIQYEKIHRAGNWCAVFHSSTVEGSKRFRMMEPPTHARWTPEEPDDEEEKKKCRAIIKELKSQIREKLEELFKTEVTDRISPDEIDIKLEDDGNDGESEDSIDIQDFEVELDAKETATKPPRIVDEEEDEEEEDDEDEEEDDEEDEDDDDDDDEEDDEEDENEQTLSLLSRATLSSRNDSACTYKVLLGGESTGTIKRLIGQITGYDGEETDENINTFTDSLGNPASVPIITKESRTLYFKLPGPPMAIGIIAKLTK